MRIIIVNTYSISRSTGLIAYALLNYLRGNGHTVKLCCRGHEDTYKDDPDIIRLNTRGATYSAALLTCLTGIEGRYNIQGTNKLLKLINDFQPDIVQLYSLHGYYINHYRLINYLKEHGIGCVYSMIDEHAYMGRCCYAQQCQQFKTECVKCPPEKAHEYPYSFFLNRANKVFHMKKALYDGYDKLVFTGPQWVYNRAKESALLNDKKIMVLEEPIDFDMYFYPRDRSQLKKKYGIGDNTKIVLNVADMRFQEKGGKYFYMMARLLEKEKNLRLINIGYHKNVGMAVPQNVIAIPYVYSQDTLAEYLSLADVFVHTSLIDTQPNICLDAMGCGTPIIGFAAMGNPYIAPKEIGTFVKERDYHALAELVKTYPLKTEATVERCKEYARLRFSHNVVFSKLTTIYESLVSNRRDATTQ